MSPATRERVLAAAQQLGYRPNALARAMISGRSRLIALLVAYLDNHFYPLVLELLARELQERGYQVLLFMTNTGDQDTVVQKMLQFQVEGIIMASATLSSTLAMECVNTGTPVVLLNRYVPSSPASSVVCDNIEGGRQLAHFLADGGHRRIAFIAGQEDSSTSRDREAGFCKGLAERASRSGGAAWAATRSMARRKRRGPSSRLATGRTQCSWRTTTWPSPSWMCCAGNWDCACRRTFPSSASTMFRRPAGAATP